MAKKGERVGAMGDSVYYRTPDGQIIDDSGNVLKGPMAKMLADEYESKQQEKAKAQAEAKAAADEAKRQAAAAKSAEIARKAAEKEALQKQRQEQQEARRQEAQAASDARRQQAESNRQRTANVKQSAPPKQTQQAPAADAPQSMGDKVKGAFKEAAINAGATAFNAAFPSFAIKPQGNAAAGGGGGSASDATDGSVRQAVNRVADEVNTTNMMMQTSIARQEMTNQILGSILKEVQQIKKPSLIDAAADALSGLGGGKGKASSKVSPKSGMLGAAGSALRRAPIIGALLGGGLSGYDEYQESGNAGRAVSTGAGAAAGGGLGAWGGATAGAALGAFGGPVGMAIGGLLGAAAGGIGGSYLGGKAGKGVYDAVASPSTPAAAAIGPQSSNDIKAAQAAGVPQTDNPEAPKDSVVNVKTLTFNAENMIFNVKNQQNNTTTPNTPATAAGPTGVIPKTGNAGSSLPVPGGQIISGPTQSGSIREALATAQSPNSFGSGTSIIQDARAGVASASFSVTPGGLAPPRVQPNQGAMSAGSASFGGASIGGQSDASAVKLAESMVGKSRGQSLDFLRAGGYNNQGEAWCAQFVNSTLKQTGGQGSGSAVANSFQNWGSSVDPAQIQPGDVVLQTRGKGAGQTGGHVGVATGVYKNGQVEMIAGNTSGAVRKYMVPVNAQLMVRRGAGSSTQLAGADKSKADPTVGGTPGAIKPSTGATQASLTPKENAALGAASASAKGGDPTSRKFDTDGKKIEPATGGMKRMNPVTGKFEEIPKPDNSDPYLRKVKSPLSMVDSPATQDAIKRAKESADQASGISGPKTYNTETGQWEAYQLKEQPKYEPAKISEPKPITKGAELSRASTKDMVDERSAKTGITVNQNTVNTPTTDGSKGKYSSGDVGIVEPVDARLRLKELFGMTSFG